ncbi:hypothetical protein [Armatimonas sp.]|uniref:hypothetical protein n=1 Tax=Armatimonas sp. TaxID=1872638 RepID=UPI00286A944C|nr:hypothetical protein [Armatimonas sp.]
MMDQPPPQTPAPLPPFVLSNFSSLSAKELRWDREFSFVWGDLKLLSGKASYVVKDKTLLAEGNVTAKLGTERVEGKDLKITGLDMAARSVSKEGFGFYFTDAKLFSPVLYIAGKTLSVSSETGAEARRLLFVPGPDPKGEIELSADRLRSQPGSGRLFFENATVRVLGNRLITLPRLGVTPRYDRKREEQSLVLPIIYRTSRVSGVVAGVRLPFAPVGGAPGTFIVESTTLQGWNVLATARKELLGQPTSPESEEPNLFTGVRNATQKERSFEERVRPFIIARPPVAPDLSLRRYAQALSAPVVLDPLPLQSKPSLALEATVESNREFVRRGAFLLRSRLPEAVLTGRIPGSKGEGGWLATLGGGPAREKFLDGSGKQVQADRLIGSLGWEAPRIKLSPHSQAHALLRQTEQRYPHAHYSISELRLSTDYGFAPQTGLSGGVALRRAQGKSPFLFDTLEALSEAQLRGQTQLGNLTVALMGRWDLRTRQIFDQEIALGWRGKTIEPRLTWRSQNQQVGFTINLPALTGF